MIPLPIQLSWGKAEPWSAAEVPGAWLCLHPTPAMNPLDTTQPPFPSSISLTGIFKNTWVFVSVGLWLLRAAASTLAGLCSFKGSLATPAYSKPAWG